MNGQYDAGCVMLAALSLASLTSCVGDLHLPTPPDVSREAQRYEAPTAEFGSENAADIIHEFVEGRARLARADDFREAVDALVRLDSEVTVSPDGSTSSVEIQGTPIQADALIEVIGDCPGFLEGPPASDAFSFSLVVQRSVLIPVVWGTISDCRFERVVAGQTVQVRLGAELIAYLPNMVLAKEEPIILYIEYEITDLNVSGEALPVWTGNFRIVSRGLEILVEAPKGGTAVLFQKRGVAEIGVRAANGEWTCFPEERRCESLQLPSFSY